MSSVKVKLFSTKLQSFSQDEIISFIPIDVLSKIKETDEHPFFTMYSICHTGESSPVIIGEGSKKINWFKKAIQSIKNIVVKGVKFFKGHNKDNSHAGRKSLGEVIYSFQKEIKGVLHQLVIGYHPADVVEEVKLYDVCSQESEWNIFEEAGQLVADSIESITAIALAKSDEEIPAFAGAKRLGYIQAFEPSGKDDTNVNKNKGENIMAGDQGNDPNATIIPDPKVEPKKDPVNSFVDSNNGNQSNSRKQALTFQELKDEIIRMKVFPSDVFVEEDIKRDRKFAGVFNELDIVTGKKAEAEKKLKVYERKESLALAKDKIEAITKEKKHPEKIANFILKRFEKEKNTIDDLTDKGLSDFIEDKITLYQDTAKDIDPGFDIKQIDGDSKSGTGDYTKAADNELLDEDFDED